MSSFFVFFFFKQKTAYEMRISDWSSDVCSSDLVRDRLDLVAFVQGEKTSHTHLPSDELGFRQPSDDHLRRHFPIAAEQEPRHIDFGTTFGLARDAIDRVPSCKADRKSTRLNSSN